MDHQELDYVPPTARLFWMAHHFRIASTHTDRYELECLDGYENPRTLPKAKVAGLKQSGDLLVEPFYFDWDGKPAKTNSPIHMLASKSPAEIRQTMLAYTKAKFLDRAYRAGKVTLYETQPKPSSTRRRRQTGKVTVDVWLKENEAAIQAACYPFYLLDPDAPKPNAKPRVGQQGLPALGSASKIKKDRQKLASKKFKITDLSPNIDAMRNGGRKLAPDMAAFVKVQIREVLLRPERMDLAQFRRHIRAELKNIPAMRKRTPPSAGAIENLIETLDNAMVIAARFGIKKATESRTIYTEGMEFSYPGELVLMDCWKIDLVARLNDQGGWAFFSDPELKEWGLRRRLWVAWVIDAYSRAILGMALGLSESSELTTRALRMAVSAKELECLDADCEATPIPAFGFDGLLTDIGGAFKHPYFMVPALSLVPDADIGPGDSAHLRGLLERFNRTVKQQFLSYFTGTTFGNIVSKGEYDAMERASADVETLGRGLWLSVNDVYNLSPHRGNDGQPPVNRLEDRFLSNGVPDAYSDEQVRVAFGKEFQLPVTREGVCFASNHYVSGRLQSYFSKMGPLKSGRPRKVRAKVDLCNLGRISVYFEGEWHTLAGPQRVQNVGFTDWQETRKHLQKLYGEQAEANADIVASALRKLERMGTAARLKSKVRDMSYDSDEVIKAANRIKLRIKEDETATEPGRLLAFDSSVDEAAFPAIGTDMDAEAEIEAAEDPYVDIEEEARDETELGLDDGNIDQDGEIIEVDEPSFEDQSASDDADPETPAGNTSKPDPKKKSSPPPAAKPFAFLPQPTRKKTS